MGSAMGPQQSMANHRATALRTMQGSPPFPRAFPIIPHSTNRSPWPWTGEKTSSLQSLLKHCRALTQCHKHYYFSLCSVTVELSGPTAHECHRSVHTKQKEPKTAAQEATTKSKLKVSQHKMSQITALRTITSVVPQGCRL